MKTNDTFLLLALSLSTTAIACDFDKDDDGDTNAATSAADDGAESGDDEGSPASATSGSPYTATSGGDSGCDAPNISVSGPVDTWGGVTTDPGDPTGSWSDTGGGFTTWVPPDTDSDTGGPAGATATSDDADTDGLGCGLPFPPGNYEYGCMCEDESCEIYYTNVEQMPDFDQLCTCLCEAKGCGEAVGGVAEGGGEEDGGPP